LEYNSRNIQINKTLSTRTADNTRFFTPAICSTGNAPLWGVCHRLLTATSRELPRVAYITFHDTREPLVASISSLK
jgi:hypothetical protein